MKPAIFLFAFLALAATPNLAKASSAEEINAAANATLHRFVEHDARGLFRIRRRLFSLRTR
jgi:hypothetical protein